jgi:hypothetical protein
MSERDWSPPGITPTPGERYEWEDFVGARWTATLVSWSSVQMDDVDGHPCVGLRLVFEDRGAFETNLPVRFRPSGETTTE